MNRRQGGFSLAELLVLVLLGTVMVAAVYQSLASQERSSRVQQAAMQIGQNNRTALDLLGSEIRELDARGGDLVMAQPESIRFRAYRKYAVVCGKAAGGQYLEVWDMGQQLAPRDSVAIFVDSDTLRVTDDRWVVAEAADTSTAGTCTSWGGYPVRRVWLPSWLHPLGQDSIFPGATVRAFVQVTYGLFASNGEWYLGRRNADGSIDRLLGPLSDTTSRALRFAYYDSVDNVVTPNDPTTRNRVRRIGLTIRGSSRGALGQGRTYSDSLSTHLFLRNN